MRTKYSAPPTHHADSQAHRQSEYPMAQTASDAAEHTEHISCRPRPSLSKRFRRPTVGLVCSSL